MNRRSSLLVLFLVLLTLGASASGKPAPRRWLLAVGVTGYTKVSPLHGCENDARLMAQVLVRNCGFDPACVKILEPARVDRRGIEEAFKTWLIDQAGPDDEIVFFFSGHGTQVDLGGVTHEALCPVDIDPKDPRTLVLDSDLSAWIKQTRAARVVVVLDACNSGTNVKALVIGSSSKFVSMEGGPRTPLTAAWDDFGKTIEGFGRTVLLAACQATETAADTKIVGDDGVAVSHGAFTWALTRVLQCVDPQSSVGLAYEDLLSRARHIVRYQLNELQTPVLRGSHGNCAAFSLATVVPVASANRDASQALPDAAGRPLLVSIRDFDNDAGGVTRSVRESLARVPVVRLCGPGEAADLVVSGRIEQGIHLRVTAPSGRVVRAIDAPSPQRAAEEVEGEARCAYSFGWLSRLQNPVAPFTISVSADRADPASYRMGELLHFRVRSNRDCHVTLVDISTDGSIAVLYPNRFHSGSLVKAGQEVVIPDGSFRIAASGLPGREMVVAIATTEPTRLNTLVTATSPGAFYQFADAQSFRKTVISALSSTKGLAPQGSPVARSTDWAEGHTVITLTP